MLEERRDDFISAAKLLRPMTFAANDVRGERLSREEAAS